MFIHCSQAYDICTRHLEDNLAFLIIVLEHVLAYIIELSIHLLIENGNMAKTVMQDTKKIRSFQGSA